MKPILFNTEQARNILDGRKTNTRRPIKQSGWLERPLSREKDGSVWFATNRYTQFCCKPLYKRGDILYVRETWAKRTFDERRFYYKADDNLGSILNREDDKWRPSIHMPREAARIFLKVTDVRVERLQDITPDDMDKEGLPFCMSIAPYDGFEEMWNAIYAKRGYSWNSNPWVWVYEFERMKGEQG
jgi:hypothetical protein